MMEKKTKDLGYYLALPYPIELIPDREDNTWYAKIPLLPGCMSDGATPTQAVENLKEAQALWIVLALEDGDDIPEPEPVKAN